ncbi:hypothetical protein GCM10027184_53520 [Saccharothrix stipae]
MTTTPDTTDADAAAPDEATGHVTDDDTTIDDRTVYPYVVHGIDPRTLRADGNSRVVGDIRETRPALVASVAEHGVDPRISIINVAPDPDGALAVLVGFHRHAAAVAVKERENPALTVDLLVHAPGTRREVLVVQGIENILREDYTTVEQAELYGQLALEGMNAEAIARELSLPDAQVNAGLAVAASTRTRVAGKALPTADMFQLSQLAEFGDDEQAHQQLVDVMTNRPHQFEWTIEQLRDKREQQALLARETQRFTDLGYALVDDENDLPDGVERLDELCAGDTVEPLDPDGHADCPGRAVSVWADRDLEVEVIHLCVDYTAHGHRTIASVRVAEAEDRLRADGVPIVDPDTDGMVRLHELLADAQAQHSVSPEEHAGCPGHAAYVLDRPSRAITDVQYVCTDYAANGHALRFAQTAQPEHDAAWQTSERKRASVNNRLWRDAKVDRRKWLTKYFAGWRKRKAAELPPRLQHWLALAPMLAGDYLAEPGHTHDYACSLLTLTEPQDHRRDHNPITVLLRRKSTTETQAVLIRLAQVVGACEKHWDLAYTDKSADASWRRPSEDTQFYFELLAALGYPLSHVEQLVNNPDLDQEKWPHLAPTDTDDATAAQPLRS